MASIKNTKDQIPFLAKVPKTGNNNVNVKTVRIALPNNTFNPKPTGNIWMKGAMIIKAGMLKIRLSILRDFWVMINAANKNNPK
jgi:hypothetical protein